MYALEVPDRLLIVKMQINRQIVLVRQHTVTMGNSETGFQSENFSEWLCVGVEVHRPTGRRRREGRGCRIVRDGTRWSKE